MKTFMPSTLTVLSISVLLTSCADNTNRIEKIGVAKAGLEASRQLPPLDPRCREEVAVDLKEGERLDSALMRANAAVNRANLNTRACAEWYDTIRACWAGSENKEAAFLKIRGY